MTSQPAGLDTLTLANDHLAVAFDEATGGITRLTNVKLGIDLISLPTAAPPWRAAIDDQVWTEAFSTVTFETIGDAGLRIRWGGGGIEVIATVRLEGDVLTFGVDAHPTSGQTLDIIEYPIVGGIGSLGEGDTMLAHPQGTGFLFRNPHDLFTAERPGIRYSPYPEGFSGSSLQCFAYYTDGVGGFDVAIHDASGAMKWLNTWRADDSTLRFTVMHQSSDVGPGNGYAPSYTVRIGALMEGSWEAAAERYRAWALQQRWATGREPSWLHSDVGLASFGINAAYDRAPWLRAIHEAAGTPVFHVLGVNWPTLGGDYRGTFPGSRADWFPARFDAANLTAIREQGDYWAPFEFDLLQNPNGDERDEIGAALVTFQEETYSFDAYHFPFHCPVVPYFRDLHAWRDAEMVRAWQPDAVYYDISANNVTMQCRSAGHGHPVGGGGWMVEAYRDLWGSTRQAMRAVRPTDTLQGAEMVNEVFLDRLDYYQARAEAAPLSPFESGFFRDWIIAGQVENIPFFTFVYHGVGPVRLDGWGKLAAETGDLWYWVAARVAIWGGIFEVNAEFSPLEVLDGVMEDITQHYADIDDIRREIDPARLAFVGEIAGARVGFANPWLAHGTMQRSLPITSPTQALDWHFYNFDPRHETWGQRGVLDVPQVQHAVWRDPDGRLGVAFVNLHETGSIDLDIPIDRRRYELPEVPAWTLLTADGSTDVSADRTADGWQVHLTLPPRVVTMLVAETPPHERGPE